MDTRSAAAYAGAMNRRVVVSSAAAVLVVVAGCKSHPSPEQIRKDGYGCTTPNAGAKMVQKKGEHCFVCSDGSTMLKCTLDPLNSGCKEDPTGCKQE